MPIFETSRLICIPLTPADYESFKMGIEPSWRGFTNPFKHLVDGPSPLRFRIPKVERQPEFADIGLILAITKSTKEVIGSAGFHDFPDETGMIEIGFGIVPEKQNQGYGIELLMGMWKMICERQDVKTLRYTVSPKNKPSLHIITKLGFKNVGGQIDDEDGLELIFEKSAREFITSNL